MTEETSILIEVWRVRDESSLSILKQKDKRKRYNQLIVANLPYVCIKTYNTLSVIGVGYTPT